MNEFTVNDSRTKVTRIKLIKNPSTGNDINGHYLAYQLADSGNKWWGHPDAGCTYAADGIEITGEDTFTVRMVEGFGNGNPVHFQITSTAVTRFFDGKGFTKSSQNNNDDDDYEEDDGVDNRIKSKKEQKKERKRREKEERKEQKRQEKADNRFFLYNWIDEAINSPFCYICYPFVWIIQLVWWIIKLPFKLIWWIVKLPFGG